MSTRPPPPLARPSPQSAAPKTIKLKPHDLLALPYRLTHPPPPHASSSTWGITPHFRIPLEEILDRKHLPPLGLKDFEEWLLLIDRMPECLYFILWLREYKARYTAWMRKSKRSSPIRCSSNPDARTYRSVSVPPPPNPALVQFYMRAKETFLAPHAPYALPLPLDMLAQFSPPSDHASHVYRHPDYLLGVPGQPPHPPSPDVFGEVEERVIAMLTDSLDRFVVATFHNVGMPRAYCGCAGGTVIGLTGSLPILLANFLTGGSRWWRFSALPGMWLGMTIVISALYGVCMMIYVFGDLRQLRSFELARMLETPSSAKQKDLPRPPASIQPVAVQAPLTGPPLLRHHSPSFAPSPKATRPLPPKLRLTTPPPAHTIMHVHTSRSSSSHAHMQSVSSASTSYSVKPPAKPLSVPFPYPEDEESSGDDLEYSSDEDDGYDTEADSDTSHISRDGAATSETSPTVDDRRVPKRRRRRRREPRIHISDAIYDEEPAPEGPAMGDALDSPRRSSIWGDDSGAVAVGATFIYPFQWEDIEASSSCHDIESQAQCASERQWIGVFDFDGLPPRPPRPSRNNSTTGTLPSPTTPTFAQANFAAPSDLEKSRGVHFASDTEGNRGRCSPASSTFNPGRVRRFLGKVQALCIPSNIGILMSRMTPSTSVALDGLPESSSATQTAAPGMPVSPSSTLRPPSIVLPAPSEKPLIVCSADEVKTTWRSRVRRMLQVPAFGSPLTPVLNPIITRGQWEIVVRSSILAFLLSAIVIGGLVGAPETRVV